MKPYHEESIDEQVVIRTFSPDVDESEMKWHWDEEDRTIIPLSDNNWMFQFDNQLPVPINRVINIPAGVIHRAIKGTSELKVKIIKL